MRQSCKEYKSYSSTEENLMISFMLKKNRNYFFLSNQNKISGPTLKNIFAVIFVAGLGTVWKEVCNAGEVIKSNHVRQIYLCSYRHTSCQLNPNIQYT